jgi:hypothetical protein
VWRWLLALLQGDRDVARWANDLQASYLRDKWNILDAIIVVASLAGLVINSHALPALMYGIVNRRSFAPVLVWLKLCC